MNESVVLIGATGAGGGTRTHTMLPPTDFESVTSTIPSHRHNFVLYVENYRKIVKCCAGIINYCRDLVLRRNRVNPERTFVFVGRPA